MRSDQQSGLACLSISVPLVLVFLFVLLWMRDQYQYLRQSRGFREFAMDCSKQVIGSACLTLFRRWRFFTFYQSHSERSGAQHCIRFVLEMSIDSTLGILAAYIWLRVLTIIIMQLLARKRSATSQLVSLRHLEFKCGSYRDPQTNEFLLRIYLEQLALWLFTLFITQATIYPFRMLLRHQQTFWEHIARSILVGTQDKTFNNLLFLFVVPSCWNIVSVFAFDQVLRARNAEAELPETWPF